MLREKTRFLVRAVIFTDFILISSSYLITGYFFAIDAIELHFAMASGIFVLFLLSLNKVYSSMRTKSYTAITKEVIFAHVQALAFIMLFALVFKKLEISRFISVFLLCSSFLILLRRTAAKLVLSRIRRRGHNLRNVLVVGATPLGRNFVNLLSEYSHLGCRILGFLSANEEDIGKSVSGTDCKIIGRFDDIDFVLKTNTIDEVVFAANEKELRWDQLRNALLICEEYGVKTSILPVFFNLRFARLRLEEIGDLNLVTFIPYNVAQFPRIIKWAIDVAVSAAALLAAGPLMAAIAIAIKAESPGPVFFVQKRCGLNGRLFNFLKFRSMSAGAEALQKDLLCDNEMSGPIFKIKNDPRITRVGMFLRKYSLDELPQFINVLKGDMSLVGPRPPLPDEVAKYERWQRRRLSVKPGITCYWQVSGRNGIDFDTWMKLDLDYIDKWSLKLDLELLLKTFPAVIKGTGM